MLKRLVEVSLRPQLFLRPRALEEIVVLGELGCGEIVIDQSVERSLRREHPRFDPEVDAFQARAIEVTGRVTGNEKTIAVHPRHREISAFGNRLGAGSNHLAALKNGADRGMELEPLKLVMRIQR